MKTLDVLAVVHMGKYEKDGKVIDDKCPCCEWDLGETPEGKNCDGEPEAKPESDPLWHLGEIWAPGADRGIGAYFRVYHCQKCGLVYATHLN